jgi:energy-coupling factor transporter ATP-binding protein EcfA2
MDPINRRHVWDVIEAAKQDRCVILTTHSMEEADVLGDTVAIMAKGRLRCLGSTVRLKARFGAGYKLSVSLGDKTDQDSPQLRAVHEMMNRHLAARPAADSSKSHVHYNVPAEKESMLTLTFAELEARRVELGIVDLQIEMSTLEDVFLKIAKDSEVEEAIRDNRKTAVTLSSGEVVQVLVGSEEPYVSTNGVHYRVVWNTDENGQLVASDTLEDEPRIVTAVAPADAAARIVSVEVDGKYYSVPVPDGVGPCSEFQATVQVLKQEASSEAAIGDFAMSRTEVAQSTSSVHIQSELKHVIALTKPTLDV